MYFMDFYRGKLTSDRYYLFGSNEFLKILAQDKISKETGMLIQRISDKSELESISTPLFGGARIKLVPPNIMSKEWPSPLIKLSNKRMPADLKKVGFVDVVCNELFPSQVRTLTQMFLSENQIQHNQQYVTDLCEANRYDPYSIYNTITLLSLLPEKHIEDLGPELISMDLYKIMDFFMDGRITDFLSTAEASRIKIRDLIISMITVINKMTGALALEGNLTWYQNRLRTAAQLYGFGRLNPLLRLLNDMYIDHETRQEVQWLKLKRMMMDIGGC